MNSLQHFHVKRTLRLFILLINLEVFVLGIFLLRVRSLDVGSGLFGYSPPRLFLIGLWFICFGICVWTMVSMLKATEQFRRVCIQMEEALASKTSFMNIHSWLLVVVSICWGVVFWSHYNPQFLSHIWPSFPAFAQQYVVVIFIIGLVSVQSMFLMWKASQLELFAHDRLGTLNAQATLLFLLAFSVYSYTAIYFEFPIRSKVSYFPELASSFLQGRLDLVNPTATKDLTVFDGKYYVSFPPLAALLLIPFVAWQGAERINVLLFNHFFAALGVAFTYLMLEAMKLLGWNRLRWWENMALSIFLGFGTAQYYLSEKTLVNLISHILTTTFLVISFWSAFVGARRQQQRYYFLAGVGLGLAMLARPNVIFAWLGLVAIFFNGLRKENNDNWTVHFRRLIVLSIPVIVVVLGLLWYNQMRFHSPFDFGYTYMLLKEPDDLIQFGQFHPHFIAENLYDNFLRLPYWESKCNSIAPNPQGTSILLTSPLVIFLFLAWKKDLWAQGLWISIGLIGLTHALYYNSGALQFGYRFSMDFIPLVVALLAFGFRDRLPKLALALIVYSVLVNYVGVLWVTHRWCENF